MRTESQVSLPIGGSSSDIITFLVPEQSPSSGGWIDLSESYIKFKLAIRLRGVDVGTAIPADGLPCARNFFADASMETCFGHTLFNRIRTYLGGIDLSNDSGGFEPYSAFSYDALTKPKGYGNSRACYGASVGTGVEADVGPPPTPVAPDTGAKFRYGGFMTTEDGYEEGIVFADVDGDYFSSRYVSDSRSALSFRMTDKSSESNGTIVIVPGASIIEVCYKPRNGIWNVPKGYMLPPNTSMRLELTKSGERIPFRSPGQHTGLEAYIDWTAGSGSSAELYLKRRYPQQALAEALMARSLVEGRALMVPFMRCRTHVSTHSSTETTVDIVGLLAGPRPEVACIMVVDTLSVTKALVGNQGGENFGLFQMSGSAFANTQQGAGELVSFPPHVTSAQVRWGGRSVPLRALRQPSAQEMTEAYKMYRQASEGALSWAQWRNAHTMYVFPLSDANDTRAAFKGDHADMGDGDRGSLEVHLEVVPNLSLGAAALNRAYTVIVCGWGIAAAAISPDSGVVQRRGF